MSDPMIAWLLPGVLCADFGDLSGDDLADALSDRFATTAGRVQAATLEADDVRDRDGNLVIGQVSFAPFAFACDTFAGPGPALVLAHLAGPTGVIAERASLARVVSALTDEFGVCVTIDDIELTD